jgi:hypothetical protein
MNDVINKLIEKSYGEIDFTLISHLKARYPQPYFTFKPILTGNDNGKFHVLIQFNIFTDEIEYQISAIIYQRYIGNNNVWYVTGSKFIFGYSDCSISNDNNAIERLSKLLDGEILKSIYYCEEYGEYDDKGKKICEKDYINGTGKYKIKLRESNVLTDHY